MELLILKTNISSTKKIERLLPIFTSHPIIQRWSIDTEDIDNVLRIELTKKRTSNDIIEMIKGQGFHCETLPDH